MTQATDRSAGKGKDANARAWRESLLPAYEPRIGALVIFKTLLDDERTAVIVQP